MMRSPAQSDFVVIRPPRLREPPRLAGRPHRPDEMPPLAVRYELAEIELSDLRTAAEPIMLPTAWLRSSEASAFATRWVMRAALVLLLALLVLTMVGPHIPSGE
jgi:hypothetical protein